MQAQKLKTPELSELADLLAEHGWQQLSQSVAVLNYCDHLWQKKIDCSAVCQATGELFVNLYNYSSLAGGKDDGHERAGSFALEIVAQSTDGYWSRHEKYGIRGSELEHVLEDQIAKLIKAWKALN